MICQSVRKFLVSALPYGLVRAHKKAKKAMPVEHRILRHRSKIRPHKRWKHSYADYSLEPLRDDWVLYEAHGGIGMVCNPYALFRAFQERTDFYCYQHIWVIKDEAEMELLREEYKSFPNVHFIFCESKAYACFLAKSKYLINNTSFPGVFAKREGQVFLNTWHSITVKSLGYDTPGGHVIIKNMLRNFLASDYLVSPNAFMRGIYDDSFRLRDIYTGTYIEEGYPRNDRVVKTRKEEILKKLEQRGTIVDPSKKIILYAPTWTGNNASAPVIDMSKYNDLLDHLSSHIDMDRYQILVKPHHVVYRRLSREDMESGRYVSYAIDTNELLSIVDILITDYSSIYFDYMVADKPILFYIPDFEEYSKIRGIYFTLDQLPGPCSFDLPSLTDSIHRIEEIIVSYAPIRHETMAWACKHDDGNVSDRVLDVVFSGNRQHNLRKARQTGKKRLLFYVGGLATNGVTSAALSLFHALDYDKYDVTLFILNVTKDNETSFLKIPDSIRTMVRCDYQQLSSKLKEVYTKSNYSSYAVDEEEKEIQRFLMKREFRRCFGDAEFDHIVDFSGYGAYFPMVALYGTEGKNIPFLMWQHNDMFLDLNNKKKNALNQNKMTLDALLCTYPHCDKVVSSTKAVYEINRDNLATKETAHKFTYATNLIDQNRICSLLAEAEAVHTEGYVSYPNFVNKNGMMDVTLIPFPEGEHTHHFVTMGRCMPEKNHANLIRAIKMLVDQGVDAWLYIIGDGHCRPELEALAEKLGIAQRICITGFLANPFILLKKCDCFVFPSIYESQGLAVMEARMAKLPIILGNYKAVSSVMLEDKQYLLKGSGAKDIYEGLQAYLRGEVPGDYCLDLDSYNRKALEEFETLIGG